LPMAPMGVMPVSPDTRAATAARKKLSPTAAVPVSGSMPKKPYCAATPETSASTSPATNQPPGTTAPSSRTPGPGADASGRRRRAAASTNDASGATTRSETPGQSSHSTMAPNQGAPGAPGSAQPRASAHG